MDFNQINNKYMFIQQIKERRELHRLQWFDVQTQSSVDVSERIKYLNITCVVEKESVVAYLVEVKESVVLK